MVYPKLFRPLVVVSSLAPLSIAASYPEVSGDQCNCYLTNGTNGQYFTTHKFFDFRDKIDYAGDPDIIDNAANTSEATATSDYFLSSEWTDSWATQNWNNSAALTSNKTDAVTLMIHSPNNLYLERNQDQDADSNTFLTLRTARLKDFQSTCEFESAAHNYHYLSARMYARTIGAPGAVTAMFTYRDSSGEGDRSAVEESDLEIRTVDPTDRIQYTNQPSSTEVGNNVQESTRNVTIPNKRDWTNWAVYRLDWSSNATTWYINGDQVASITYRTPHDPSMIIFNAWSNGGSWTGNMSVGAAAYLQIQWIELVYNSTGDPSSGESKEKRGLTELPGNPKSLFGKRDDGGCTNVCSIDETDKLGTPVLLPSSAPGMFGQVGGFWGVFFWTTLFSSAWALL
ncbi:glycoside hydrolase family 16 protein [Hypoxylon sp. FL1857]|nr:glycoside hydrolase family 16 protein [Hypoxylon sp. FL1857]